MNFISADIWGCKSWKDDFVYYYFPKAVTALSFFKTYMHFRGGIHLAELPKQSNIN